MSAILRRKYAEGGDVEEAKFRSWYAEHAARLKLDPDPDAPEHHYDYRAAHRAGAGPGPDGHWPSTYKREGHPRTFINEETGETSAEPREGMRDTRRADGGRVGSSLDELLSITGDSSASIEERRRAAAENPELIGHDVKDTRAVARGGRRLSDDQILETLRAQLDDPARDPGSEGTLRAEIARMERVLGRSQGAIERTRTRPVKASGAALKDDELGAQLMGLNLKPVDERSLDEQTASLTEAEVASQPARAIATRRGGVQIAPADLGVKEPPQREADWLDVIKNSPAGLVTGGKKAAAGIAWMAQENKRADVGAELATGKTQAERADEARALSHRRALPGGGFDVESNYDARDLAARGAAARPSMEPEREAELSAAFDQATKKGEELKAWVAQISKEEELTTPQDMTTGQQAFWSLVQSAPPTLAGIGVGIVTRNPLTAMAIAGVGGAGFQTGSTYTEAREKGAPHELAAYAAKIDGILEGIGESIPLAAALKPGSRFIRRLVTTVGEEAGQEGITQLLQDFNAYLTYDPNITLGEAWQNFKVATLAGAMGGAVYSTIGHLADRTPVGATGPAEPPQEPHAGPPPAATPEGDRGAFTPTHRLDGIPVVAHQEEGAPVAGVWRDAEGNYHEAPRAEPIQSPESNAIWQVNGVDYDVEVVAKGSAPDTARLHDGQEVPLAQLDLEDDAKVILGLMPPPEEEQGNKKKGEGAAAAAPNSNKTAPEAKAPGQAKPAAPVGGETEPPPPRGSRRPAPVEQPVAAGPITTPEQVKAHNATVLASPAFMALAAKGNVDVVADQAGALVGLGPLNSWPKGVAQAVFDRKMFKASLGLEEGKVTEVNVEGNDAHLKEVEPFAAALRKSIGAPNAAERRERRNAELRRAGEERKRFNPDHDGMIEFLIKSGGIDPSLKSEFSADENPRIPFVGYLFRKGGAKELDGLVEKLHEAKFMTDADVENQRDTGGTRLVVDRLMDELAGRRKHYSMLKSGFKSEEEERYEREQDKWQGMDEAAGDEAGVPIEHVVPEDLAHEDVEPTAENVAITELMARLPEEDAERLAVQHEDAGALLAALKARIKELEHERPAHPEKPPVSEAAARGEPGAQEKRAGARPDAGGQTAANATGKAESAEEGAVRQGSRTEVKEPEVEYQAIDPAKVPDPSNLAPLFKDPEGTLILMACSQTKVEGSKPLELFNLYDGPLWQTLRSKLGRIPKHHVIVLSAKHAWASSGLLDTAYNERLSAQRADELIRIGLTGSPPIHGLPKTGGPRIDTSGSLYQHLMSPSDWGKRKFTNVIMVGGADYMRVFHAAVTQMRQAGLLAEGVSVKQPAGGIGEQRSALGGFLDRINWPFETDQRAADEKTLEKARGAGPLFIPLKTEHYAAFEAGTKDTEYRKYGGQWTEQHVYPGRKVVLSKGYGKQARLTGTVVEARRGAPPDDAAWKAIYGDEKDAFHIKIKVDGPTVETVQPGEKGLQRQREDKAVKRYLSAKRPGEKDTQRIISYRTEATMGYHKAVEAKAPDAIQEFLRGEHDWAMERLKVLSPKTYEHLVGADAHAAVQGVTVRVKAVEAETGREIELDEDASIALDDVDGRIAKTLDLLECVRS